MTLRLEKLTVNCVIGERPDERTRLQPLEVDVEMELPPTAAETDSLSDTVDYAALVERIRAALVAAQCRMIEHAAKVIRDVCAEGDGRSRPQSVRVTVTKRGAIVGLGAASATYP